VLDIDGDGRPEVLLTPETGAAGVNLEVYKQQPDGKWRDLGHIEVMCADAVSALRAGQIKTDGRTVTDVVAAGRRLSLTPSISPDCTPPPKAP
jgi:hypothetical protein